MSLSRKIITGLTGWLGLSNRQVGVDDSVGKCDHDWEEVETDSKYACVYPLEGPFALPHELRGVCPRHNDRYRVAIHKEYKICSDIGRAEFMAIMRDPTRSVRRPQNKVCVRCGECRNEHAEFEAAYKEQEREKAQKRKEARRRKTWAEQLWADGCKNR